MRATFPQTCRRTAVHAMVSSLCVVSICLATHGRPSSAAEGKTNQRIAVTSGVDITSSLAFSPDSRMLCWLDLRVGDPQRTPRITVWNIEKREPQVTFATDKMAVGRTICFAPRGDSVLIAVRSWEWGRIDVHRVTDGSVLARHELPPRSTKRDSGLVERGGAKRQAFPESMFFLTDGTRLVVRRDHDLYLLDGETFAVAKALDVNYGGQVGVSPDGKFLAAGVQPERGRRSGLELQVWSLESLAKTYSRGMAQKIVMATLSPTEPRLLTWGDFVWQTWWMEGGTLKPLAQGMHRSNSYSPANMPISATFSPEGRMFATASSTSRAVRLWDAQTGRELSQLIHSGPVDYGIGVLPIAFSPNGKYLASATHLVTEGGNGAPAGCEVYLWDLTSNKPTSSYAR